MYFKHNKYYNKYSIYVDKHKNGSLFLLQKKKWHLFVQYTYINTYNNKPNIYKIF